MTTGFTSYQKVPTVSQNEKVITINIYTGCWKNNELKAYRHVGDLKTWTKFRNMLSSEIEVSKNSTALSEMTSYLHKE